MNHGLIRTTTVFALFSMLLLALALAIYVSPAGAQGHGDGTDHEESSIDMDTDDDGNGIPDEFETEFRELLDTMLAMDSGSLKMGDIYGGDAYKALNGFYERLSIEASTKQVLDELPGLYQKLMLDDELEKDPEALNKIVAKELKVIEDDEVYADAVRYIHEIMADITRSGGEATSGQGDDFDVSALQQQQPNADDYESLINRVGDIIFRDTRTDRGVKDSFDHQYAMRWTHSGVYAGSGRAYDSDAGGGIGCTGDGSGVALRSLTRYYRSGYGVQHSQMKNVSARSSEAAALDAAQDRFGVACQTPFEGNSDRNSTDSFYCSKLVWRIYYDNEDHPTNVDSNHPTYWAWLNVKYSWLAWYIIIYWVAPDEIALDWDLDQHYRHYIP